MHAASRLRLILVWSVIALLTGAAVFLQSWRAGGGADAADPAGRMVAPIPLQSELVGKICVALREVSPLTPTDEVMANAEPLRTGGLADRLAYAILLGRVASWEEGLEQLKVVEVPEDEVGRDADELRKQVEEALRWRLLLGKAEAIDDAMGDGDSSVAVETLDRVLAPELASPWQPLEPKLGFFARTLGPDADGEALVTLGVLVVTGFWYLLAFLGGVAVLGTLAGLGVFGKLKPRMEPAPDRRAALVLGETFAIWMAAFLGLNIAGAVVAGFLISALGDGVAEYAGLVSISAFLASLSVLAWPRLRGVGFAELRGLVGLHAGAGVLREAGAGVLCYLGAVPFLAFGLGVYALLSILRELLFGGGAQPSHPAVEQLGSAGPAGVGLLFLLAAVVAPIVEEIAFRGVLYGHLRGVVSPRIRVASALVAALVSSFIFAVVHPQGVLFVPALGGLAVGFCIFRELRGSLIAPMVAHGINNAVTLTIGLWLMG